MNGKPLVITVELTPEYADDNYRKKGIFMQHLYLSIPMQVLEISSSWMWRSAVKPWHILPFAFAAVCLTELLVLRYMGGVSKWSRLLPIVLGSNAVCFGAYGISLDRSAAPLRPVARWG